MSGASPAVSHSRQTLARKLILNLSHCATETEPATDLETIVAYIEFDFHH
ncbi:hypothetical protein LMG24076_03444 [Trinickia soli]|nr:hypothetical protein LMG24076_03444 [Trinickia soli]